MSPTFVLWQTVRYESDQTGKEYPGVLVRDGSLRANFKAAAIREGFPVEEYARGVCHELIYSLSSLVGEEGGSGEWALQLLQLQLEIWEVGTSL